MKFPTYPPDILSRADALLSEKYPDGIVDPALVILMCRMGMAEREDWEDEGSLRAAHAEHARQQRHIDEAVAAERERCARIAEMHEHRGEIAKAIRGTK